MSVLITGFYAGLLGLVGILLAGKVGAMRGRKKIALGDQGDPEMIVAIRRHMNFVEYVPLALILIGLVELNGGPKTLVHVLGAGLLAARVVHPFGLDPNDMTKWQRIAGAAATILVIVAAAVTLLWQYLS